MKHSYVWSRRNEETVLDCLEEACRNMGYVNVYNWHKIDRAHEEGVDIECLNPKERVVIQAKIKPAKSDLVQLQKLSQSTASKKIYVYIKNPSAIFQKEMEIKKRSVEFWDSDELHSFLIGYRSLLYLRFLLLSCDMVKDLLKGLYEIFSCREVASQKLESQHLEKWWLLKDRAVKLHANTEYIESSWKDYLFKTDHHDKNEYEKIVEQLLISSSLISQSSSKDLVDLIIEIKSTYPGILSEYINVVLGRTNWSRMYRVKRNISNDKEVAELLEKWVVPEPNIYSEYSQIAEYLDNLNEIAIAIEDGVDWLFEDYLETKT